MNRNLLVYLGLLGAGVLGFLWVRKNKSGASSSGSGGSSAAKTPAYSQQQEVSDFQIFSALTSQQQASDVNLLTEAASLFSGGSSTAATGAGSGAVSGSGGGSPATGVSSVPSPTPAATTAPVTTPASTASAPSNPGVTYIEPGGPVNFSQPPPPGYGYSFQNGQWGLIPGGGVGYVAA